jgi:hypothetical protein
MRTFLILLLTGLRVLAGETDIRVTRTAQTNAENASVYVKEVFTRGGETNLVQITKKRPEGTTRICHFYHAGQLVGNFVADPNSSVFNTEAGPYCLSLRFSLSEEIESVRIGSKVGALLDEFHYSKGAFSPVEGPLTQSGLMKPNFGPQADSLPKREH